MTRYTRLSELGLVTRHHDNRALPTEIHLSGIMNEQMA
jgi:hypothetical protein